jgi:GTPase
MTDSTSNDPAEDRKAGSEVEDAAGLRPPARPPAAAPQRSEGNSGEEKQRCGLVAVIGAPNAGKSTLVNALVGQKVAITSAKAQTTRARMLGIALEGETQMILVDTPGIFAPKRRLDRAMVSAAWEGTEAADAVLLMVDPIKQRRHELEPLLEALANRPERKVLVLNKVDAAKKEPLLTLAQELTGKVDFAEVFFVSALTGDGVPEMKAALAAMMPQAEWMYPEDQVSDASERLLAAEITREQLYRQLHEELPYDSAVRPELYQHRPDGSLEIHQQIVVTRDNQRAIVLGKGGSKIKAIGEAARKELSELLGVKVHLFLHVKVEENWSESREIFEEIGLDWGR